MRPAHDPRLHWQALFAEDSDHAIATRAQLERQNLYWMADAQAAQRIVVELTLHGKGTTRPHECVALTSETDLARLSPRVIGHEIAATELVMRRPAPGHRWHRATRLGPGRDTVPDWLLWDVEAQRTAALVELDLGYSNSRLDAKLIGAVGQVEGPVGYILGTTLKGRVQAFTERAEALAADLPQLAWVEAWWLDVESPVNRYAGSRRSKKVSFACWERTAEARPPGVGR